VEEDIRKLSEWLGYEVIELDVQIDLRIVSIPPKVSSRYMGTIKGKIAIKIFKSYPRLKQKPYWGNHFWTRSYFVNTVGINEDMIRKYVKYKEKEERREARDQSGFKAPELDF
jgi:putative transposase